MQLFYQNVLVFCPFLNIALAIKESEYATSCASPYGTLASMLLRKFARTAQILLHCARALADSSIRDLLHVFSHRTELTGEDRRVYDVTSRGSVIGLMP